MPVPSTTQTPSAETELGGDLASLIRDSSRGRTGSAMALPISPNYPFFLLHHPTDWQVESVGLEGPTWLPGLSRHTILPGCNLNRTLRQGELPHAAYDAAVLANVRKGATYIDIESHRLPGGGKYLREAPCRDTRTGRTGIYYLDGFTAPRDAVPNRRLRFAFDRPAWNVWRLGLVASGVIRPPSQQILDEVIRRKRRRHSRVQAHTNLEAAEYARRLDRAEAAVDRYTGALVPGPVGGATPMMPSSPGYVPDLDDAAVA